MTWQEVYKLPLRIDNFYSIKVWTADNQMAFDFVNDIDEEIKRAIVDKINGNQISVQIIPPNNQDIEFSYSNGIIAFGNYNLLRIRGFGYLIGTGGLHLTMKKACKIQDEFGQYICDKLNGKESN